MYLDVNRLRKFFFCIFKEGIDLEGLIKWVDYSKKKLKIDIV